MRLFWAALAIVVFFALDRAYMDGQTADQLVSLAYTAGAYVNRAADELLRPLHG